MDIISGTSNIEHICELCKKESPDVLLIAGCTGSGKSTLAKAITEKLQVSRLCLDDYFKDENEMELVIPELGIRQWDAPDCYKWDMLASNLQAIFRHEIVMVPNFSHEKSRQMGWKKLSIKSRPLIVEGLYTLRPEILNVIQSMRLKIISIFLDIPEDERWKRKYNRDVLERNENPDTLRAWFDNVIKPAEEKWINPQMQDANIKIIKCK